MPTVQAIVKKGLGFFPTYGVSKNILLDFLFKKNHVFREIGTEYFYKSV